MTKPSGPKMAQLHALIAEKAATLDGFSFDSALHLFVEKTAHKECKKLMDAGTLFRTRIGKFSYFDTQAGADALIARKKAAAIKSRDAGYALRNIERVALRKRNTEKRLAQVAAHAEPRKPVVVVRPRDDAEVIHTANTLYSARSMTDRFAVHRPFLRIGDADWSMRI